MVALFYFHEVQNTAVTGCHGLTFQPATKHQTAARSPLPFLPPAGWGGEWTKGETRGLR